MCVWTTCPESCVKVAWLRFESTTCQSQVRCPDHCTIMTTQKQIHPELRNHTRASQCVENYDNHRGHSRSFRRLVSTFSTVFATGDYETVETDCTLSYTHLHTQPNPPKYIKKQLAAPTPLNSKMPAPMRNRCIATSQQNTRQQSIRRNYTSKTSSITR